MRFIYFSFIIFLPLFSYCTTTSNAGEVEGVVVMVGSVPNARPVIEPNGPKSQIEICKGSEQDYLRNFGSTVVKATGDWVSSDLTKERCFMIRSFVVTQLVKGRTAYTGLLQKDNDKYSLVPDEATSKPMQLEHPSKGVVALAGKKLIMDLLPSSKVEVNGIQSQVYKVVSYMELPSR
jgi:hypothetical protein